MVFPRQILINIRTKIFFVINTFYNNIINNNSTPALLNDGGKRAGKMMTAGATPGNVGIALLRLEHVLGVSEDQHVETIKPERLLTASDNVVVRPFVVC